MSLIIELRANVDQSSTRAAERQRRFQVDVEHDDDDDDDDLCRCSQLHLKSALSVCVCSSGGRAKSPAVITPIECGSLHERGR